MPCSYHLQTLQQALQGFVSNSTLQKCCKGHKNGSNSTFATFVFWLKVVALVAVAIGIMQQIMF
jgi:hypothetical protein